MKKYTVIKFFTDLQDNRHPYNVGDTFPREGVDVTQKRLKELAGRNNKQHKPLIKAVNVPDVKTEDPVPVPDSEIPEISEMDEKGIDEIDKKPADEKPRRGRKKKEAE
jgi:hypothetical protein